jgi:hypothetical protein
MGYNMKIFKTPGLVTLITPPSMIKGGKISFLLVNLKEEEKDQFATQINNIFPEDNVNVYIIDQDCKQGWVDQATQEAKYIIIDKTNIPIWLDEIISTKKVFEINSEQSVEQAFQNIKKTHFPE